MGLYGKEFDAALDIASAKFPASSETKSENHLKTKVATDAKFIYSICFIFTMLLAGNDIKISLVNE